MYFDRFDIIEAYYLALSHCYQGQWDKNYARLCSMAKYFKPSPILSLDSLSENGQMIYKETCNRLLSK